MLSLLLAAALSDPRIETFALHDGSSPRPVGVVRLVGARGEGGKRLLEAEFALFEPGLVVRHTEELYPLQDEDPDALRAKLVWREVDDRIGRSLVAERFVEPEARLRVTDASRGDNVRTERSGDAARAAFPWTRLERARRGGAPDRRPVFLPLEGAAVELQEVDGPGPIPFSRARLWRRSDGRGAIRAWWVGRHLAGFQWNDGLVATRISAARYRALGGSSTGLARAAQPPSGQARPERQRASDVLAFDRR